MLNGDSVDKIKYGVHVVASCRRATYKVVLDNQIHPCLPNVKVINHNGELVGVTRLLVVDLPGFLVVQKQQLNRNTQETRGTVLCSQLGSVAMTDNELTDEELAKTLDEELSVILAKRIKAKPVDRIVWETDDEPISIVGVHKPPTR
jgi:hypothetical protein